MKIYNKKSSLYKRPQLWVLLASILLIVAIGVYWAFLMPGVNKEVNPIDYNSPTDKQKEAGREAKENFLEDKTSSPTTQSETLPNGKQSASIIINQADQSADGTVQIRAIIQAIDSSGVCTLTMTRDGLSVTKIAPSITQSSFSSCAGFDIPKAEIPPGLWNILVEYDGQSFSGKTSHSLEVR